MSVKSPFPGMDPWLERSWGDVHQRLIIYASDVLNEHLPAGLIARTEERVFVESPADQVRHTVPDVRVVETPAPRVARAWNAGSSSAVVFAEPEILEFDGVQLTESYIEIRDFSSGGKVVTTIEVVSPSNKAAGPGRKKYLRKQRESVDAECNLVEIDLLRSGRGVTLSSRHFRHRVKRCDYHVSTFRATAGLRLEFYPVALRDRLPVLRVPLRAADEDAPLDLQAVFDRTYVAARYAMSTDYDRPPEPPLDDADAEWAKPLIAEWSKQFE